MIDAKNPQARGEQIDNAIKDGFDRYLELPLVRLVLSTLPPGKEPETMKQLLQDTFRSGFNAGAGFVTADITKAVLNGVMRKQTPDKDLN